MAKNKSLCVVFTAIVIVLICVLSAPQTNAEQVERYGFSLLQNDMQRTAYNSIAAGIAALESEIIIPISGITSSEQFLDIKIAAGMVCKDYPEYYWYHGEFSLNSNGQQVTFFPAAYTIEGQTVTAGSAVLVAAQAKVNAAVREALKNISRTSSDYEISLAVHDYIVNHISYAMVGDHQTAYGALGAGKAVCAGYARAYQLIMNAAGISCWYVEGQSYDPNGQLVAHAWNVSWLDGKCYYSDTTWDDQGTELFHEFMNVSLEDISSSHFTSDQIPQSCNHSDYTFFRRNNTQGVCDIQTVKTIDEVAQCFQLKRLTNGEAEYYCTIHYHGDDFSTWLNNNIAAIAQNLGFTGSLRYSVIELYREHHVTIVGTVSQSSSEETEPQTEPGTEPPTEPSTEPATEQPTELSTQPPTENYEQTVPTTRAPESSEPDPTVITTFPPDTQVPVQTEIVSGGAFSETTDPSTLPQDTGNDCTTALSNPSSPGNVQESSASGNNLPEKELNSGNGEVKTVVFLCVFAVAAIAVVVVMILKKKKIV